MAEESDFQLQNSNRAIDFAIEAVKAGMVLNGGAIVALLAFMSSDKRPDSFSPSQIRESLTWFAVGLGAAFLACIVGYVSQTLFATANQRAVAGKDHDDGWAIFAAWVGVSLVVASLVIFLTAAGLARNVIVPA